jgi:phosphonate dehydrogenase
VHARDAVALCFFVPDRIDAAVMDQLPALRILAGFGKGFDNVDVPAATERGIWVTNVTAALSDATADLAWALLLANARGVVCGDARVREYPDIGWDVAAELGRAVTGATIGVYGFGLVGRAIAERSLGFRMSVLYCDPTPAAREVEERLGARRVDAAELLAQADYVVLAVPLVDATYHLIDAAALGQMKATAILVNPARGSIVDEAAIAEALERGTLGGYAADVFEHEDRQYAGRPTRLLPALVDDRRRTVFTPHLGTAVAADRVALALAQARAVRAVLAGERPDCAVNVLSA